ncbi:hypothetical protein CLG96_14210 [Sphingomonas oleivorans]|uniref:Uncharacterized protein n=2 Tax=Sphingomonas oleivorans TaxID=1735121 RepID=A0A2T5FWV6_9SPHN|nr:hypothetical protein CLG96_14210 [Sphingomonas oleivorans]
MYEGYVNAVEPTCMPVSVGFQTDNGAGSCPAGSWLNWLAKGSDAAAKAANTQAVLSVLITAQVTHRKVRLHGNNLNCTIDFIHLL